MDSDLVKDDHDFRLQELEKAVTALCLLTLDDSGDIDSMLAREKIIKGFVDHAATLQKYPQIVKGVVDDNSP